jgi:uncharacterized membrane protein YfcA
MPHPELLFFFFAIALIYASVGFGGGSSYLAVLALYALPFKEIRLIALACNVIVVTSGTLIFIRHQQVNWRKILPLTLTSVPLAFLGASLKISQETFFIVLGISLVTAAVLLWLQTKLVLAEPETSKPAFLQDMFLGGGIGFLSGFVGIGGGIFLAPLLNLLHWDSPKKIAATASVFILVNSVSGLAGQFFHLPENVDFSRIGLLCVAVLIGGQIGSRLGALKFNPLLVRRLTAVLVFAAGLEVLLKHMPWFK